MKINIFKNKKLFKELAKHNEELIKNYRDYNDDKSTWIFNPDRAAELDVNRNLTKGTTIQQRLLPDKNNYILPMYAPNYLVLFLINLFYPNQKDILIEDICAGMGRLIFYLSKCDYTNFSIIEDFSQVSKNLMQGILVDINYILNDYSTNPAVINIAGYPNYPKNHIPNSVELFCGYGNALLLETAEKMLGKNYVELCTDHNMITKAFCRKEKFDEFYNIIKPLEDKIL